MERPRITRTVGLGVDRYCGEARSCYHDQKSPYRPHLNLMSFRPQTFAEAKASFKPMKRSRLAARKKINPVGKKGSEWISVRTKLKKLFNWAGITVCEFRFRGCYYDSSGGFAHCKKRRNLLESEIWHVGLSCLNCHTILDEKMSHEEMEQAVHQVIDRRGILAPPAVLQQISGNQNGG